MDDNTFMKKYMKGLEGRTIVKTGVNKDGFPFFTLDDKSKIEVSQDPEGNGPGFLFGLQIPPKDK
jgi:hypothetical protein